MQGGMPLAPVLDGDICPSTDNSVGGAYITDPVNFRNTLIIRMKFFDE